MRRQNRLRIRWHTRCSELPRLLIFPIFAQCCAEIIWRLVVIHHNRRWPISLAIFLVWLSIPFLTLAQETAQPGPAAPSVAAPTPAPRSEERRVGKSVDLGGRRSIKKKITD